MLARSSHACTTFFGLRKRLATGRAGARDLHKAAQHLAALHYARGNAPAKPSLWKCLESTASNVTGRSFM